MATADAHMAVSDAVDIWDAVPCVPRRLAYDEFATIVFVCRMQRWTCSGAWRRR